jgi:hypothetical protein
VPAQRRPRPAPANALSPAERDRVRELLHDPAFVDKAPAQVWAGLLDDGIYLCSESTMYRILRERGESRERRRQATHPPKVKPELVAHKPGLGLHTPASVHLGTAKEIRAARAEVLAAAYARNPERFNRRPEPPKLPTVAWINPPSDPTQLQSN